MTTISSFSRRSLLRFSALGTAALGTGALGATALTAPARADDVWTDEFMTRIETREGFDVNAMTDWQIENARFIIAVAAGHGISAYGTQIALATSIVEAWLYNYGPEIDYDSGGLFQQRPAMGWGTYDQVRHKKLAIDAFFGLGEHSQNPGLLDLTPDYKGMDFGAAAQAVQRSAHPERYGEMRGAAEAIWDRFAADVQPYVG